MIKIRVMIVIIMIRQRKIILCIAIVMMRMIEINMAVTNGFASYHFPALSSSYFPHHFQCINFAAPVMPSFVFLLYQCLKFPCQMLYSFTSLIPRFILTLYPHRLLFHLTFTVSSIHSILLSQSFTVLPQSQIFFLYLQ